MRRRGGDGYDGSAGNVYHCCGDHDGGTCDYLNDRNSRNHHDHYYYNDNGAAGSATPAGIDAGHQ